MLLHFLRPEVGRREPSASHLVSYTRQAPGRTGGLPQRVSTHWMKRGSSGEGWQLEDGPQKRAAVRQEPLRNLQEKSQLQTPARSRVHGAIVSVGSHQKKQNCFEGDETGTYHRN